MGKTIEIFILILSFYSTAVFAETEVISLDQTPNHIKMAVKSVVSFKIPAGKIRFIEKDELSALKVSDLTAQVDLESLQIVRCLNLGMSICPVFEESSKASAFIVGDGSLMFTSLHTFILSGHFSLLSSIFKFPDLLSAQDIQKIRNFPIPIIVEDSQGKVIFPTKGFEFASMVGFPQNTYYHKKESIYESISYYGEDFALLQFPKTISNHSLKISKELPSSDSECYGIGYPSNVNEPTITKGLIYSIEQGVELNGYKSWFDANPSYYPAFERMLTYSSHFGRRGMSGGPLVCEDGTAVAIAAFGRDSSDAGGVITPALAGYLNLVHVMDIIKKNSLKSED